MSKNIYFNTLNNHNWNNLFKHHKKHHLKYQELTLEENINLIKQYQNGGKDAQKALEKLTKQYVLFLANTIKPFIQLAENWNDIFQEGYIGMLNAYKKYDERKGHPGTYAKVAIQHAVVQYLRKEKKFSIDKYVEVNDFKDMDKSSLIKNEEDLYNQLFRKEELKYEVKQVINFASWPNREIDILEKSYGLNGQEEHNTQQIANHHSLTRSRINQIKGDLKKDIKHIERKRKTLKLFI